MSKINFSVIVESLLCESVSISKKLTPSTGEVNFDKLEQVYQLTVRMLHSTSTQGKEIGGRPTKEVLMTYKPIFPFADTFQYIYNVLTDANVIKQGVDGVRALFETIKNNENIIDAKGLISKINLNPNIQVDEEVEKNIDQRLLYLERNSKNIDEFQYYNATFKGFVNTTSAIAAEPYLKLTPQESIVTVLQEFGGYDVQTAEKIVMFPGENKYTQRGPNIGGVVMGSIIDISKLLLVFYRQHIQQHAEQIVDHLNYFLESSDRWYIFRGVDQSSLNQLVRQIVGKKLPAEREQTKQRVIQATTTTGREINLTDPVAKYIHDDYVAFLNGMSGLVLESYDFTPTQKPEETEQEEQQGQKGQQTPTQLNQQRVNSGRNAARVAPPRSQQTTPSSGFSADAARLGDNLNLFDKFYNKIFINEQNQPQPVPLIKTIEDFSTLSGTGQQVFQAYLHLFNNMREGEIPSKWETGTKTGMDILGGMASNLASTFSKFRGF
jgi:hypothetical protein